MYLLEIIREIKKPGRGRAFLSLIGKLGGGGRFTKKLQTIFTSYM